MTDGVGWVWSMIIFNLIQSEEPMKHIVFETSNGRINKMISSKLNRAELERSAVWAVGVFTTLLSLLCL